MKLPFEGKRHQAGVSGVTSSPPWQLSLGQPHHPIHERWGAWHGADGAGVSSDRLPRCYDHTPHSGALIPICRMGRTKIRVHFLSLLEQITANWGLKRTNLFSHSSGGQKSKVQELAGLAFSVDEADTSPCLFPSFR